MKASRKRNLFLFRGHFGRPPEKGGHSPSPESVDHQDHRGPPLRTRIFFFFFSARSPGPPAQRTSCAAAGPPWAPWKRADSGSENAEKTPEAKRNGLWGTGPQPPSSLGVGWAVARFCIGVGFFPFGERVLAHQFEAAWGATGGQCTVRGQSFYICCGCKFLGLVARLCFRVSFSLKARLPCLMGCWRFCFA